MAIRFIDTSFFKSPFVRGLRGASKTLYCFIICDCNNAGIWNKDTQVASLFIDQKYTDAEFERDFVKSGKAIFVQTGRYFFPDFIDHQYPKGLQAQNPAHKNIIHELLKFSLLDKDLKPLRRPSKGSIDMDKGKGEVKDEDTGTDIPPPTPKPKPKEFEPPTQQEVEVFVQGEGYPYELAVKVYRYYTDADWHDSKGNKVRNWKQKIRGVWLKEENRTNGKQQQQRTGLDPQKLMEAVARQNGLIK